MLVLTRKLGQNVVIGKDIFIKVIAIDNNKVQLGFQAPESVTIYRNELIERVKKQNQSSVLNQRSKLVFAARQIKRLWNIKY